MLKFFNNINIVFVIVTVLAHTVGYIVESILGSGISIQFFLGIYQLLFAAILMLVSYRDFDPYSKRLIMIYWMAVGTFLVLACLVPYSHSNIVPSIVIIVIPMMIACYQVYAFYKINEQLNQHPS